MGSARDEKDVVPRCRHTRAEISADRTRRHCSNTHVIFRLCHHTGSPVCPVSAAL
jgi:hypothetical protein